MPRAPLARQLRLLKCETAVARVATPAAGFPWAWLPRETAEALVLRVVALTVLLWAFFYSSSPERPPQVDLSHTFLERQPVSPLLPAPSTE